MSLPNFCPAFRGEIEEVVAVDVVEVVPEVGGHDDAVHAKTGVGVDIGVLQDAELIVPILNRPDVGVGFV